MATAKRSEAVDALAAAVFEGRDPWVAEAFSAFDKKPLQFSSASELAGFATRKLAAANGLAYCFVVYPDMRGRAVRETIRLKPGSVPGHRLRYTWQGWGLISLQLAAEEAGMSSRIAVNSEARAKRWASTEPSWDSPATWNWSAVASHARRLQRVLKQVGG